jgi:hypothetical protein
MKNHLFNPVLLSMFLSFLMRDCLGFSFQDAPQNSREYCHWIEQERWLANDLAQNARPDVHEDPDSDKGT